MSYTELEEQVKKNTAAISSVSNSLSEYVPTAEINKTNTSVARNSADITNVRTDLTSTLHQIDLQSRVSAMKDVNLVDTAKNDLFQFDGDRWTNISPSKVISELIGNLEDLKDTNIVNKKNDLALAWDSEQLKWVNKSLNTDIYEDMFIRKDVPDFDKNLLTLQGGVVIGEEGFGEGITGFGAKIDKFGHAEFESIVCRRYLEVPELRYNRVEILLGDKWNAPGAGIIESVEVDGTSDTGVINLKLEDGEYGAVSVGDLCMGIYHSEKPAENSDSDEDDGQGNRQFAGFYTVYFEVVNIIEEQHNSRFGYRLRPISERWPYSFHPTGGMTFVAYGNKTNKERQTSCYSTRTYTRYLVDQDTWEQGAKNIAMLFGDLSNLNMWGYVMDGYSAYLNSVYFTGTITQVKPNGEEILYANDRGAWEPNTHYDYYDRVSILGYLWLCVGKDGSDAKPADGDPNWLRLVDKGDIGPTGSGMMIRKAEWKTNIDYHNDADVPPTTTDVRYLDIALKKDIATTTGYKAYQCKKSHYSTLDNQPGISGGNEYWEELSLNVTSLYTDLIVAKDSKIDFMAGNALRITNNNIVVAGITGLDDGNEAIRIWAGAPEANRGSAPFRVTLDGKLYASNAYITGTVYATNGSFTGTIYATDGEFSGKITTYDGNNRIVIGDPKGKIEMFSNISGLPGKTFELYTERYNPSWAYSHMTLHMTSNGTGNKPFLRVEPNNMYFAYSGEPGAIGPGNSIQVFNNTTLRAPDGHIYENTCYIRLYDSTANKTLILSPRGTWTT